MCLLSYLCNCEDRADAGTLSTGKEPCSRKPRPCLAPPQKVWMCPADASVDSRGLAPVNLLWRESCALLIRSAGNLGPVQILGRWKLMHHAYPTRVWHDWMPAAENGWPLGVVREENVELLSAGTPLCRAYLSDSKAIYTISGLRRKGTAYWGLQSEQARRESLGRDVTCHVLQGESLEHNPQLYFGRIDVYPWRFWRAIFFSLIINMTAGRDPKIFFELVRVLPDGLHFADQE